ncbi:MAG: hypothetical protein WD063_08000 [Pirellulales bacterium]
MKWLAISLGLLAVLATSGCWRPYYGGRFGQPAYAQPAYAQPGYAQPGYAQPTYSQPVVQQGVAVEAQPQVIQAAPAGQPCQPCVPCPPNPCCVPCY